MTAKQMYVRSDDKAEMIEITSIEYVAVRPALLLGLISRVEVEAARNSTSATSEKIVSLSDYLKERAQDGEKV